MNFGLPSPIDVQLVGPNFADNFEVARKMLPRIQEVGGAVDVHIQQALDLPKLHVEVDRTRAESIGFTQQDVANNALVALTTSFQTAPNFWVSPQGVPYVVATLTPQYRVDTMRSVQGIPVIGRNGQPQILDNVASITREAGPAVVNHYDIMPVIDIYASAQDRDLGGVAAGVSKVIDDFKSQLLARARRSSCAGKWLRCARPSQDWRSDCSSRSCWCIC